MKLLFTSALLIATIGFNASSFAQKQGPVSAENEANPDPVYIFNRICYSQVPDVEAINQMSGQLGWRDMEASEIEQFKSIDNPDILYGWNVQAGERLFKVGLVQGKLTEGMKRSFPEFADGVATSCSMILDDQQDATKFMPNMQLLAGKEPISRNIPQGALLTTTWAGGNEDLKVFLFAKVPPSNKGGLFSVAVISKK